jgi:hypothetical protein
MYLGGGAGPTDSEPKFLVLLQKLKPAVKWGKSQLRAGVAMLYNMSVLRQSTPTPSLPLPRTRPFHIDCSIFEYFGKHSSLSVVVGVERCSHIHSP